MKQPRQLTFDSLPGIREPAEKPKRESKHNPIVHDGMTRRKITQFITQCPVKCKDRFNYGKCTLCIVKVDCWPRVDTPGAI